MTVQYLDDTNELRKNLFFFFNLLEPMVVRLATSRGITLEELRFQEPLNKCFFVGDEVVIVGLESLARGSDGRFNAYQCTDLSINKESAVYLAKKDLRFRNPFTIQFPSDILELKIQELEAPLAQVANSIFIEEVERIKRLRNIVKIDPIFAGRDFRLDESLVFVLSPFEEQFDIIYQDHIEPTIQRVDGLRCLRADDIYDNLPIMEDIWRLINEAGIVIAELTGKNPNVFYETGIAHTIGKEVILLTQSMGDVPFDLRHFRCIEYAHSPRAAKRLEEDLEATIRSILSRN